MRGRAYVSDRIYRALLLAYPKEFREGYGAQMAQAFGDLRREEQRRGRAFGLAGLWFRTLLDVCCEVFTPTAL